MKIWTSEHVFSHPWETVVTAAWRKYPNPMNPAVVGIDVVDRRVENGILRTKRLLSTEWGLPLWAVRILGADQTCFALEHSAIDPSKKLMTSQSTNLTFCNELSIMEKLTYTPHPSIPGSTLLKQEAVITVHGVPLSSYFEEFISKTISVNANKGRLAMEWVIGKINCEVQELTKSVDGLTASAKRCISEDLKSSQYHFQRPGS
ncbi:protein slowmo-like protein [Dinothrombium tinctorium]|uniref:Protein slowmo-like protein n=1 Tax=Dinothrombium tinctorium TaxID=1965070 RepID=A0A3S3P741_9ACAR|nr:protein slowmo-like protein [Dinothrombium tinctorium]RWS06267.1 protein slowmo-like protein [Dinothrombium tinctorium]RWS06620.1 protein slowmo-like protein [Dinothrombium tinctorium]